METTLLESNISLDTAPFFTVAIPNYNRRRYLEVNIQSLLEQTFEDFEILISDDNSKDDTNEVIPSVLKASGRQFSYYAQPVNLGYDGNVRFCLREARGRYVLMLGNDDALVDNDTLQKVADMLRSLDMPEVAITNYEDWESGVVTRRAYSTCVLGSGLSTATHFFRSFSFTSGLIFSREQAAKHETSKWDASVYYQIFLACRIIASGGHMAALDVSVVRDNIRLQGEIAANTYAKRYENAPWSMKVHHTGLDSVARVTIDSLLPFVHPSQKSATIVKVFNQLLCITYPFWLFEYRRLANLGYAIGIARDFWPGKRLAEYDLRLVHRLYLWGLYGFITAIGLTVPAFLFNGIRHNLADFVRRFRQNQDLPSRQYQKSTMEP